MSPPATGIRMTQPPSVLSAGERSANERLPKKNRFVNRWIRLSSTKAASVLSAPITAASAEMPGNRALVEKSRLWVSRLIALLKIDLGNGESAIERPEFGTVQFREPREHFFAGFQQVHFDLPAIGFAHLALDEIERFATGDERHDAVMLR